MGSVSAWGERDFEQDLASTAASLVEPGEEVQGSCVANRKRFLTGRVAPMIIAQERLIAQGMRRFAAASYRVNVDVSNLPDRERNGNPERS